MSSKLGLLRELLEKESYPHLYTHKFIGQNTPSFNDSVAIFERDFPKAQRVGGHMSSGAAYLSYSYELLAESPDEILQMIEASASIQDLKMVL